MGSHKLKPKNANVPWIVSFEFPSYADAKAFASLVEAQFGDKAIVRKKNIVYNQGAFTQWRTTQAIRKALSRRSFDSQMVGEVLASHGYAGTRAGANAWIVRAYTEAVIVRLERGIYEFPRTSLPANKCATCQPEPLQCQPA